MYPSSCKITLFDLSTLKTPFFAHIFNSKTCNNLNIFASKTIRSSKSSLLKVVIEATVMEQCSSNVKSNVTKQMRQSSKLVKIQVLGNGLKLEHDCIAKNICYISAIYCAWHLGFDMLHNNTFQFWHPTYQTSHNPQCLSTTSYIWHTTFHYCFHYHLSYIWRYRRYTLLRFNYYSFKVRNVHKVA